MRCPACDGPTAVLQTRARYKHGRWKHSPDPDDLDVRRRRCCQDCGLRFTTYEYVAMTRQEYAALAARRGEHVRAGFGRT